MKRSESHAWKKYYGAIELLFPIMPAVSSVVSSLGITKQVKSMSFAYTGQIKSSSIIGRIWINLPYWT